MPVHNDFGADHLNKKCYFLEVLAIFRLCTAPEVRKTSKVFACLLFGLQTTPYSFVVIFVRMSAKRRRT